MEHALTHFVADKALSRILKYIDKAPEKNLLKILNVAEKHFKMFPQKNFQKMKAAVNDKDNVYMQLAKNILSDIDRDLVKSLLVSMGVHAGYYGTKTVRANRDKYNIETVDKNIDFRRVRNLNVYFSDTAITLTNDITKIAEWQGGDIVVFNKHVGIVSDRRNKNGIPFVIHHANPYQKYYEEDILESRDDIIGHYRVS